MENGRNNSKKRNAIYQALCETKSHPTAEELLTTVRCSIPQLSLATVYRNLAQLEEDGMVTTVGSVNGHTRYDARLDRHSHFICRQCNSVSDVDLQENIDEMFSDIRSRYGNMPDSYSLNFSGLCSSCAAEKN